ncbi:MAG TPA: HD domain-containing phosphohydrolase [Negativicutes bacterium]|nr:HD domain-containing phosphohydrolase [Negativicutes bacterium]
MKLRNKLLFWITPVVILAIAWLGYFSLALVERIVFNQTTATMQVAAKQSAAEIEQWFEARHVMLTAIATDFEVEKYQPDDPRFPAMFHLLANRFSGYFNYIFIGFENKRMITTRSAPLPEGFDPTTRPWFKDVQKKQNFIITEPYADRLTGNLVTTIAVPVATPTPGVLAIDIDLNDMIALSKKAMFRAEAEVFLISSSNTVLYSTDETIESRGLHLGTIDYAPLPLYTSSAPEEMRSFYQIERANIKYTVLFSAIPSTNWHIAVAIPTSVLYAEQQHLMARIIAIALLSVLIVFTIIYWIINKITRPLAQLAATAQQLEAGDMNVRFHASESYEAIYLAQRLDKMRTRLLGTIEEKDALLEETIAQSQENETLCRQMKRLNEDLFAAYREQSVLYTQTIQALSDSVETKDRYTYGHSNRVLLYSEIIGITLGWDQKTMEHLRYAAILHDIGKIGIPEEILNKASRLTPEEYEAIKTHPALGAKILQNIPHLEEVSKAILQHHEHFDGKGYPNGIAGYDISPIARILAVADAYDAMITERPYRPASTVKAAYEELYKCAGSQFDPVIVKVFCEAIPDIEDIIKKKEAEGS